jgi:BON domain
MNYRLPRYAAAVLLSAVLALTLGCSKVQPTSAANNNASTADPQITSAIQGKLYADPAIQSKQISVDANQGVVTLSGTVATEGERTQASATAATVPGVKTVVNNIVVSNGTPVASETEPARSSAPAPKPRASRPEARRKASQSDDYYQAPSTPTPTTVAQAAPAAPLTPAPAAPVVPPPPPPPAKVTVESGTSLAVRLVDSIDSETAQQGQTFKATLDSPLAVDGEVVVPAGYDIEGHVVQVQSAGKFQGRSVLALQLDRIQVGNKHYTISTSEYRREGSSRTKNTAEKVGAGAVLGAIIGGIAGGGKGAGIGAAAGGGLGGGVQAATKGQQIKLPSETVLTFSLQAPLTVTPTTQSRNASRPKLDPTPQDNAPSNSNPQQ